MNRSPYLCLIAKRVKALAALSVAAIAIPLLLVGAEALPPIPPIEPDVNTPPNGEQISVSSSNLHQWGAVTLFHGLPSDHVRAIAQDPSGILWFGTDSGLAKYDGRRIEKVSPDRLPSARITALTLDARGVLWIGTEAGAGRLIGNQFQLISETTGQPVTSISALGSNRFAVTGRKGSVYVCSENGDSISVKSFTEKDSRLLAMTQERDGALPVSGAAMVNGKIMFATLGRGLLEIDREQIKESSARSRPYFINAISVDSAGKIWLGAETSPNDGGIYEGLSPLKVQKLASVTGAVKSMTVAPDGDLWVGTEKHGVFRLGDGRELDHFTFENTSGGLRSDLVYCCYVDRESVIWFGTDRGVCRFDPGSPHAERISNDPESNFIRCLYQSPDGSFWCGTNRGLLYRDDADTPWKAIDELSGKPVYSIVENPNSQSSSSPGSNGILIGSSSGMYSAQRQESGTWTVTRIEDSQPEGTDNIRAIRTFNGQVYVASYGRGLELLKGTALVPFWPSDPKTRLGRDLVSLHVEGTSRLWMGAAQSGVFYMDGGQVIQDSALAELEGTAVFSISGSTKSGIWLATARGLLLYKNAKLNHVLDGVDARAVVAVPESSQAWCATVGGGLYQFGGGDPAAPAYSRVDAENGLPSDNAFSLLVTNSSRGYQTVWVGTNRGLAHYSTSAVAPGLRIVRVLGKRPYQPDEIRQPLRLDYPQNVLLLEVEGVSSRTFPEQFQYSFALLDSSGKTIKEHVSREPQFVAENLSPGRYSIRAVAYSNDLVPSEPLVFAFSVASAPFPRTSAALSVLLLLALVALIWGSIQNRRLVSTNVKLEDTNKLLAQTRLQLANETENERRRIARDLHDQTLTDLRRLMLMTDELAGASGNGKSIGLRNEIEAVSTEIRHICEDLSPSVLANVGLTAALEWALNDAVAHLPVEKRFDYEFDCPDDTEDRLTLDGSTRIHVYRIVQEAISNTCRHSGAKKVRLNVEVDRDGALIVILEDDGCGFDATDKSQRRGRGLNNIESRASLIDAEASWSPRSEGGMTFRLRKPEAGHPSGEPASEPAPA